MWGGGVKERRRGGGEVGIKRLLGGVGVMRRCFRGYGGGYNAWI